MNGDVDKYGSLPVKALANDILNFFQRVNPDFPEELDHEIQFNGFKPTIIYDNSRKAIHTIAEISDEGEITVSEAYLAYLWCLSYAVITYTNSKAS